MHDVSMLLNFIIIQNIHMKFPKLYKAAQLIWDQYL